MADQPLFRVKKGNAGFVAGRFNAENQQGRCLKMLWKLGKLAIILGFVAGKESFARLEVIKASAIKASDPQSMTRLGGHNHKSD